MIVGRFEFQLDIEANARLLTLGHTFSFFFAPILTCAVREAREYVSRRVGEARCFVVGAELYFAFIYFWYHTFGKQML